MVRCWAPVKFVSSLLLLLLVVRLTLFAHRVETCRNDLTWVLVVY